jgi:hypothetical protein
MADEDTGEGALKDWYIEKLIERKIQPNDEPSWLARKSKLRTMPISSLKKIIQEINGCTPSEAMALISAEMESNPT